MLFATSLETTSDSRFATHPTSNPLAAFDQFLDPTQMVVERVQGIEVLRIVREAQTIAQQTDQFSRLEAVTGAFSTSTAPTTYADLLQLMSAMPSGTAREASPATTVPHGHPLRMEQLREDAQSAQRKYGARIEDLRADAELEDIAWNKDSEKDFWSFVITNSRWRKGLLGLVNNGNLRATWKEDNGTHLALQFVGDGSAEFVIFKRRPRSLRISRAAGIDTVQGVIQQISAFDLTQLVHP